LTQDDNKYILDKNYSGEVAVNAIFDEFSGSIVTVDLDQRSYPILIGSGILIDLGRYLQTICGSTKVVLISDTNVDPLYGSKAFSGFESAQIPGHVITVPAGESSKSATTIEAIYDQLFDFAIERSDIIVALGGGVVGDIAGYVAATFKRGIGYVQVPTTLLAMVDSSVGGKTGINHPRGKNMIGAFHQPKLVLTDIDTLETLPQRELGCGLAETIKHAVIRDQEFFVELESQFEAITRGEPETIVKMVQKNCRIKAEIVSADERESGLRGILNFGHTIGHAIETVLLDQDYHHGEAVALGMVAASRLAAKRSLITLDDCHRIINLLATFKLPIHITGELPADLLYQTMCHDKKVKDGKLNFVLPSSIGSCTTVHDLTETEIKDTINTLGEINK